MDEDCVKRQGRLQAADRRGRLRDEGSVLPPFENREGWSTHGSDYVGVRVKAWGTRLGVGVKEWGPGTVFENGI